VVQHEIVDGIYSATVDTCADDLVAVVAPRCDPAVLITTEERFPDIELTAGDPIRITIADNTITACETTE
jgi:hypothetical protein